MKQFLFAVALLTMACNDMLWAQSPNDGLMMQKKQWCTLLQYSRGSWTEYWEGTLKRSNSNLGRFTNQNVMLMSNYGISDRLNIMAALPWVQTGSDSYLQGEKGLQDLSVWAKYRWLELPMGSLRLQSFLTGGVSTPVSNYPADFLPFSIGFQSSTASLREVLHLTHNKGFYLTAQAGHTWRSAVKLDRDAFLYDDKLYYTDKTPVPDVLDAGARLGFINRKVQAEITLDYFTGLSGDDIRYNEAPFLTNKMQATSVGLFAKYFFNPFAVQVSVGKVLNGRNVGQSEMIAAGFTYLISLKKNQDKK